MNVPTAKEMADWLQQTGRTLYRKRIIESGHMFEGLVKIASSQGGGNCRWSYEISQSNPIVFKRKHDPHLNKVIRPQIYASICVDESRKGGVCFKRLDLALEVKDEEGNVLIKHHVDFANSSGIQFQEGPLFHLQFGGHTPGNSKTFEVPIKEPRWLCIPLDVVLLCEVVVANFYPEDWVELKRLPGWNDPIIRSQRLCVVPFLNALQNKVSASSRSLLDHMWAQSLGQAYEADGFP